jgi:cell wall assembly regulator SMI1
LKRIQGVISSWERIVAWLRLHAPGTAAEINPPAAEAVITAARDALGVELPADLIDWWRLADGCGGRESRSSLLPSSFAPFSVAQAMDERRSWLRSYDESLDAHLSRQPAGSTGDMFAMLPEYLPIATDGAGWHLLVDLRDGKHRGCVREYDKYEGHQPLIWEGVGEMLADVATALETGSPVTGFVPEVDDERLGWRTAG